MITEQSSFGELIRQSLSETGSFRAHVAKDISDALLIIEREHCTLALLDMEMGEATLLEIGHSLRNVYPDLYLVILADEELSAVMDTIRPWVLLRKPFLLPDFIQLMRAIPVLPDQVIDALEKDAISGNRSSNYGDQEISDIPWLRNNTHGRMVSITAGSSGHHPPMGIIAQTFSFT